VIGDEHIPQLPPDLAVSWARAIRLGIVGTFYVWVIGTPTVAIIVVMILGTLGIKENLGTWLMMAICALVILPGNAIGLLTAFGARKIQAETYRRQNGLCVRCGYDLRATVGQCPECGRILR